MAAGTVHEFKSSQVKHPLRWRLRNAAAGDKHIRLYSRRQRPSIASEMELVPNASVSHALGTNSTLCSPPPRH